METTTKLLGGWKIEEPLCYYFAGVLVTALVIRLALSMLKALEVYIESRESKSGKEPTKENTNTEVLKRHFWNECWLAFTRDARGQF